MARFGARQIEGIRRNYLYGDLSVRQLLDLLQNKVAPGAERAVRDLARLLMETEHRNRALHNERSKDETMHYTIFVKGKGGHHLRADSRGIVFQVTDDPKGHDLGEVPPWVPPGGAP
jgi:hypothetical protein